MVETENLVIGAVAVLGGLVLAGRLSTDSLPESSSGGSQTNPDVPMDSQQGSVPEPDSVTGVTGFLDTNYGGSDGTVNADNFSSFQLGYYAELYDTDTGE